LPALFAPATTTGQSALEATLFTMAKFNGLSKVTNGVALSTNSVFIIISESRKSFAAATT